MWLHCETTRRHNPRMLEALAKISEEGGSLVGVDSASFEGDPSFITALVLRFESVTAVFRAVPDDDTLSVTLSPFVVETDETLADAGSSPPWSTCLGLGVCWAWRLTNQQGYSDGVRLEFSVPGEESLATVELVVSASAIYVFVIAPTAVTREGGAVARP